VENAIVLDLVLGLRETAVGAKAQKFNVAMNPEVLKERRRYGLC
jgi:hypothetical protein